MKKLLLAVLVAILGFAGRAHAVCDSRTTTCLTNVDVSDTLTTNAASVTGTLAVTGTVTGSTVTISGAQGLRLSGSVVTITGAPAAANILAHDSNYVLYISTSTGAGAWVKVGGQ